MQFIWREKYTRNEGNICHIARDYHVTTSSSQAERWTLLDTIRVKLNKHKLPPNRIKLSVNRVLLVIWIRDPPTPSPPFKNWDSVNPFWKFGRRLNPLPPGRNRGGCTLWWCHDENALWKIQTESRYLSECIYFWMLAMSYYNVVLLYIFNIVNIVTISESFIP